MRNILHRIWTSLHYIFCTQKWSISRFWTKQRRRFGAGRSMCGDEGFLGREWNKCLSTKPNCVCEPPTQNAPLDDEAMKNWWRAGENFRSNYSKRVLALLLKIKDSNISTFFLQPKQKSIVPWKYFSSLKKKYIYI